MIGSRCKKFLTVSVTILALNFIFFTFAGAKDLSMVVKKGDFHSKISSRLWQLGKGYENRTMSAQTYAQSRYLRTEFPDKIAVYLLSEPGTIIDETALQAYGGEIIKSADNVWRARVPITI
jgi:hypothetical protein